VAACVSDGSPRLRALLSWRPLVWIGLISYGLYLFHLPLFGMVNAQHVVTSEPGRVVLRFAVALAVAALSYLFVEHPIRKGALSGRRRQLLAAGTVVFVLVAFFVSTVGARGATPLELQTYQFSRAKGLSPHDAHRVLVAGDSFASSLVSHDLPQFTDAGIDGLVEWASKCDALGGVVALSPAATSAPAPTCSFEDSYRGAVESFDPDVSVLMLGPSVVFDRAVDGQRLEVGTPAFRYYLFSRLDAMRSPLADNGAALVLTTVPCLTPSTTGSYAGLATIERDPERTAAANDALRAYAEDNDLVIADLGDLVCDNPDYLAANGVRLSPEGQVAAWNLIASEAQAAIDAPSR